MSFEEIEELPITRYKILLEQAFNLIALYRMGEFELKDSQHKREELLRYSKKFKQQGRL